MCDFAYAILCPVQATFPRSCSKAREARNVPIGLWRPNLGSALSSHQFLIKPPALSALRHSAPSSNTLYLYVAYIRSYGHVYYFEMSKASVDHEETVSPAESAPITKPVCDKTKALSYLKHSIALEYNLINQIKYR